MPESELKSLSSFEWATVGRYMVYISCVAGLKEINSNHVYSFPLTQVGTIKLIARKTRVLAQLGGNMTALERFVGIHREKLEDDELAVIRSLYCQIKTWAEIVGGHLETAREFDAQEQLELTGVAEEDDVAF